MKNFFLLMFVVCAFASGCGPDTSVTLPDKPNTEPVPVEVGDPGGGGNAANNQLKPRK